MFDRNAAIAIPSMPVCGLTGGVGSHGLECVGMPLQPSVTDFHSVGAEPDPLLGRVINDRYRIIEQIGHGGMGRVYKALQAPLDRLVALKVLGAGHDRDPNFYKRLFLEASVTAKLTHPNTITLYDYRRTEDGIRNRGTCMGSPHYIGPEQARNQGPDQRCDIYSTGVLLYHMLAGKVPFTAAAPVDIILKHLHEAPVPPRQLRPDNIAEELNDVVLKCMAKAREERFQSMDELLAQLKSVRTKVTGMAAPNSAPPHFAPDTSPNLHPISPALVAQTPPSPQPSMQTPSQPMPTLKTPAGGMHRVSH